MNKKFEDEVAQMLREKAIKHTNNTTSFDKADFDLHGPQGTFGLEVKQKDTPIDPALWSIPRGWKAKDVFILDELTQRRLVEIYGGKWGIAVRDENGNYYFAGAQEILLMPRGKAKRQVASRNGGKDSLKGKLLFNLNDFSRCNEVGDLLPRFRQYVGNRSVRLHQTDSWSFTTETVEIGGTRRTTAQREVDCKNALSGYGAD